MKIIIPHKIDKILKKLTKNFDHEFTLFGKTKIIGSEIHILDIRVPVQESTGVDTEVSQDDLEKFLLELVEDNENPKDWNMWIHSHHSMSAFWSGTDRQQMSSFNTGGPEYFFHIVLSNNGRRAAATLYKPFNVFVDEVEMSIEEATEQELLEEIEQNGVLENLKRERAELEKKIREEEGKCDTDTSYFIEELEKKNTKPVHKWLDWKNKEWDRETMEWVEKKPEEADDPSLPLSPKKRRKKIKARIEQLTTVTTGHRKECLCEDCTDLESLSSYFKKTYEKNNVFDFGERDDTKTP